MLTIYETSAKLEAIVWKVFNPANAWGATARVKEVLRLMAELTPDEYRDMWLSVYAADSELKEYEELLPIVERLDKLATRLEMEGRYTDANICWYGVKKIRGNEKTT